MDFLRKSTTFFGPLHFLWETPNTSRNGFFAFSAKLVALDEPSRHSPTTRSIGPKQRRQGTESVFVEFASLWRVQDSPTILSHDPSLLLRSIDSGHASLGKRVGLGADLLWEFPVELVHKKHYVGFPPRPTEMPYLAFVSINGKLTDVII